MSKKYERPIGWTTIEESRKLVEAGLNPETADMHYTLAEDESLYILYSDNEVAYGSDRIVPCWSLGVLESLLPEKIVEGRYEIDIRKYPLTDNVILYQIAYGSRNTSGDSWHDMVNTGESQTFIEAVMDMVLWLLNNLWVLNNKYIQKGTNNG